MDSLKDGILSMFWMKFYQIQKCIGKSPNFWYTIFEGISCKWKDKINDVLGTRKPDPRVFDQPEPEKKFQNPTRTWKKSSKPKNPTGFIC